MRHNRRFFSLGLSMGVLSALAVTRAAVAADFYIDPGAGSAQNDGSAASPWATLEGVVQAGHFGAEIHAGDTVWLRSGYHGEVVISGGDYMPPITIQAASGQKPTLRRIQFRNTAGFVARGLSISPSYGTASGTVTMIDFDSSASRVTVEDSEAFSVADASGWTEDDWVNVSSNGAQVDGTSNVLRNTVFRNVRFGIGASGPGAVIERNQVINFSADGLRGLGDDEIFQYNLVKNAYVGDPPDANHDDGFQSWSGGSGGVAVGAGEVRGIVLRGNTIINYEDDNQPFKNSLQGIGCFDGTFVDWIVENNVVITDHWHGITFLGARGVRVVNNTVIDRNDVTPGPPWISVDNHKDGTAPSGCIVRNNLVTDLANAATGVTEDHNTVIAPGDFAQFFVNAGGFDLHLVQTAPAVNAGSSDLAPSVDHDGVPRPQGSAVDIGAYEWHDASVVVPDGGFPGTGGSAAGTGGGSSSSGGGSAGGGASNGGGSGAGGNGAGTGGSPSGTGGRSGGGTTSGTAGSTAGTNGQAGTAANAGTNAEASSGDESSCGCRLASRSGHAGSIALLGLAAALIVRRRSRRG